MSGLNIAVTKVLHDVFVLSHNAVSDQNGGAPQQPAPLYGAITKPPLNHEDHGTLHPREHCGVCDQHTVSHFFRSGVWSLLYDNGVGELLKSYVSTPPSYRVGE